MRKLPLAAAGRLTGHALTAHCSLSILDLKTGLALYGADGKLIWYRSHNFRHYRAAQAGGGRDIRGSCRAGSWLNLIEVFFSKIARSFLRHIRVQSKEELVERIYRGIDQINQEPVIFRWRYKMDELVFE